MKIKVIAKTNSAGWKRLLFSYHCKSRRLFSTGVIIPASDFQPAYLEKPVLKSNPKADHYNKQISLLYHEIQQIISTLRREDKLPTADLVYEIHQDKKRIESGVKNKKSFSDVFQTFLNEKAFKSSTLKLYRNTYSQLMECFPKLVIEEFDAGCWTKFRQFLQDHKKHSANTICIRLNKLKALIKHLKATGIEIPIKSFPLPKEEIKKIFLDLKDLQKVIDFTPSTASMTEVKDLFIFQSYTALRISDLRRLNQSHVKQHDGFHFISMAAFKTSKPLMIPLNDVASHILTKYQFVLPSMTEQHYNREIKKLIRLAGITTTFEWQSYDTNGKKLFKTKYLYEVFTNHCCSRTAIKYFFSIGYTPDQVSRIVGKSLDTIMSYYYEEATEEDIIVRTKQFAQTNFRKH